MISRCVALAALSLIASTSPTSAQSAPAEAVRTLSGIPLDAPWKATVYGFAREKLGHPAWGWTHSERDYRLAAELGAKEKFNVDTDVLFAAAFLHDIGAIGEFQKEGVDHAERSVELAEPMLRDAGFPMAKWPAVRDSILTHMYDKQPGSRPEAILLHDADTLDFLGAVGVARRLAVTGSAASYDGGIARISQFADNLPGRLVTPTAKQMAPARAAEMRAFVRALDEQTVDGRLR